MKGGRLCSSHALVPSAPNRIRRGAERASGIWSAEIVQTNMLLGTVRLLTVPPLVSVVLGSACGHDPTLPGEGKVKEVWFQSQTMGYPNPAPLVSGFNVYFASGGGRIIARDIQTGNPKWEASIGRSPFSSSVEIEGENFILRNGVLVASVEFHVVGLDAITGG